MIRIHVITKWIFQDAFQAPVTSRILSHPHRRVSTVTMAPKPKTRVCLIGAGPSGCSTLFNFVELEKSGVEIPEIVCYEKQDDWGGLWNYSWRTGLDQYGEPVHGSMYRYLWSNGPKECLEFPDYTFEQHYGKPIPSFPPREVLFDYQKGRWSQNNIRKFMKFAHPVKSCVYNEDSDDFTVIAKDLKNDVVLPAERFTHVVVASGHYSTPHVPSFPGIEKFPGRVMHAHDFRDANEFKGKTLLLIGASYSAEDIALQCVKYGAKHVICTWRTKPMGYNWPAEIEERPLLTTIDGNTISFKDGSSAHVDAILLCTGYLHAYPFLPDELRLKSRNRLFPPNLYKGSLFLGGGNGKLFYVGAQDQYYTYTMFDQSALWCRNVIMGDIQLPNHEVMVADAKKWLKEEEANKDCYDEIRFQGAFMKDLCQENKYPHNLDVTEIFDIWEGHKHSDILTYRDQSFASIFTGTQSPIHHSNFMVALDDSLETFMNQTPDKLREGKIATNGSC